MDHLHQAVELLSRSEFDVIAWHDPVCDDGIPADSDEALAVLCPVLGPSATVVLHRLSRYASSTPTTWEPSVFAATFGLSSNATAGQAAKAIARLARFGFVTIGSSAVAVRTRVPPLPQRWLAALPAYLRTMASTRSSVTSHDAVSAGTSRTTAVAVESGGSR